MVSKTTSSLAAKAVKLLGEHIGIKRLLTRHKLSLEPEIGPIWAFTYLNIAKYRLCAGRDDFVLIFRVRHRSGLMTFEHTIQNGMSKMMPKKTLRSSSLNLTCFSESVVYV